MTDAAPHTLNSTGLRDEEGRPPNRLVLDWHIAEAARIGQTVLFSQFAVNAEGQDCVVASDARGAAYWMPLEEAARHEASLASALARLQVVVGRPLLLLPHGTLTQALRALKPPKDVEIGLLSYAPVLDAAPRGRGHVAPHGARPLQHLTHLEMLEAQSIHILREAVAEAARPVMMYSIGKDSSVMLHLARKAFFPSGPPFPLLHVDTRWKFQEMYQFRDHVARSLGLDLLVYTNPEAIAKNINPFDHGSAVHTDITKTQALRQVLDQHQFDLVFGGARRDEEKSRAKERVFSVRGAGHAWNPKNQRPEMWDLYNASVGRDQTIRVFPLSNWTELDVWMYIYRENIPVVPLYFAKERPVVVRDELIMMIDDERMRLEPADRIEKRTVRFRTLGCYPLSGAIESRATSVAEIIHELMQEHRSERQGRRIDADMPGSMERKKREGYF